MAPLDRNSVSLPSHLRGTYDGGSRRKARTHPSPREPGATKAQQDTIARANPHAPGNIAARHAREPPLADGVSLHIDQALKSDRVDLIFPAPLLLGRQKRRPLENLPILSHSARRASAQAPAPIPRLRRVSRTGPAKGDVVDGGAPCAGAANSDGGRIESART